MPRSTNSPIPSPPKGRPGRKAGHEQRIWERFKHSGHYPSITKEIRQNAVHGGFDLLPIITGRTLAIEGEQRKIQPRTMNRFLANGDGVAWNVAKAIAREAGTNLEILIDDILTTTKSRKGSAFGARSLDDTEIDRLANRSYRIVDQISIVPSAEIAESVVAEADHPAASDALSLVRSLNGFTSAAVEGSFPTIGKMLENETGRIVFQRLDPLDDPTLKDIFFQIVRPFWSSATKLTCWADFLPCSWETPDFMRAHHLGLFKGIAGQHLTLDDASLIAEAYNEIGDGNRGALHNKLASSEFTYEVYLSADAIANMAKRQAPFQEITPKILMEQTAYLEQLHQRYGSRLCVRQLTPQGENLVRHEAECEGMESVFVLSRDRPLHGANRSRRGQMEIVQGEKRLHRYESLFERLNHNSHDLTLNDLAQLLRGQTLRPNRTQRHDNY